jgi:hypothetical protein
MLTRGFCFCSENIRVNALCPCVRTPHRCCGFTFLRVIHRLRL